MITQKHIDAIDAAETHDEKVKAFVEAFEACDPEHQPLIRLLMEYRDDRYDAILEREYFKEVNTDEIS